MAVQDKRNTRILKEGTAPFTFYNAGDIGQQSAGGTPYIVDFTEEELSKRYYPYDFVSVNNASDEDLILLINGRANWKKVIRSGTIVTISDFKGVRSVTIFKVGTGTVNADEVEVLVQRQPMTDDEYRRRQHKVSLMQTVRNFIAGV